MRMSLLKTYLAESARSMEAPVTEDAFDFHINEVLCIESQVIEHDEDSLVVRVDARAMAILEELGMLEEKPELMDPSQPWGLANPRIIRVSDDPQGVSPFTVVGRNNLNIQPFSQWNNEQMHARNKGYILQYVGNSPEKASAASWPGETPRTGRNMSGEKLEAIEMEELFKRRSEIEKDDKDLQTKKKRDRKEISELLRLSGIKEEEQEVDGIDLKTADLDTLIDAYKEEADEDIADKILDVIKTRFGDDAAVHAEHDHQHHSEVIPADQSNVPPGPLGESEYQGHSVQLGKPSSGDVKKYKVYVKDPGTGNVKKVNFGDKNMEIKRDNPERRKNFRARHNCSDKKDRTKAGYWSCRMWSKTPVSKIV